MLQERDLGGPDQLLTPPRVWLAPSTAGHWHARTSGYAIHDRRLRRRTGCLRDLLSASAGSILDSLFDRIESGPTEADGSN